MSKKHHNLVKLDESKLIEILLRIYRENRVAVVDVFNGELKPYDMREYVEKLATGKMFDIH